uniref:C-type lectin domain-containing protein n=1 Tax=Syphacia muris TaxID=451379 RepID=A0A0N5ATT2_9BILA
MKPECEEAAKLQSEGVKIVTIDLSLMDREQKSSDFGDRCLLLTNDIGFMETFEYTLCRANCFCISPTIQFYDEKKCDIYGQCVYFEETAVGTESAKISCGINYMSLADVHSDSKDAFLTEIAKSYGAKEYIIGLEDVNGDFVWSNGKTLESDEYNLYGAGEPDVRHGNCTYAAIDTDGKAIWKTMSCSYTAPAKKYFCQKNTCDTKHYCSTEADQ